MCAYAHAACNIRGALSAALAAACVMHVHTRAVMCTCTATEQSSSMLYSYATNSATCTHTLISHDDAQSPPSLLVTGRPARVDSAMHAHRACACIRLFLRMLACASAEPSRPVRACHSTLDTGSSSALDRAACVCASRAPRGARAHRSCASPQSTGSPLAGSRRALKSAANCSATTGATSSTCTARRSSAAMLVTGRSSIPHGTMCPK